MRRPSKPDRIKAASRNLCSCGNHPEIKIFYTQMPKPKGRTGVYWSMEWGGKLHEYWDYWDARDGLDKEKVKRAACGEARRIVREGGA